MAMQGLKLEIKTGGTSPELKTNIVSRMTWHWLGPFIDLGNKKTIEMEDLYDLLPREQTEYCERIWNKCWNNELKETGKPPSVLKLFVVSAGREMFFSFMIIPAWLILVVAQVYVLRELVVVAQNSDQHLPWWKGFALVVAMMITAMFQNVCHHYSFVKGLKAGMKIKSAMSMAIFKKLMNLKTVALSGTHGGQMLNLLMNDSQKVTDACTYLAFTAFGVIDSIVVAILAALEIGIAALPGILVIFMALFVQSSLAQGIGYMRKHSVKLTDARVRTTQEILSGVRVVKYNGWTNAFLARIEGLRSAEMRWIRKAAYLRGSTSTLKDGVAPVAALVTFATYVVILKGANFTAATAFTILGLYNILVRVYIVAPIGAQAAWETKIAMKRLQQLLDLPEGDCTSSEEKMEAIRKIYPGAAVVVSEGAFSWYLENGNDAEADANVAGLPDVSKSKKIHMDTRNDKTPDSSLKNRTSEKKLATLKTINMAVSPGQLTAVIGSVGSGKSSLLQAILGEMEIVKGGFLMDGPVSYAPQQPWIINDTIKNNILFCSEYDEARFNKIVTACALDHDIKTMPAGVNTEIGEKGVNLSGGQKARISLARACYSSSNVVLLDDPLAAVDVPTARHLMENVLNDFLKGRTVILVTHNKAALELCDKVFSMQNGELKEVERAEDVIQNILEAEDEGQGSQTELSEESNFPEESSEVTAGQMKIAVSTTKSGDDSEQPTSEKDSKPTPFKEAFTSNGDGADVDFKQAKKVSLSTGGLTVKEDKGEGDVTFQTYVDYCRGSGFWLWGIVFFVMGLGQAVRVMVDFWFSLWVNNRYHLSQKMYLDIYAIWVIGMLVFALARGLIFIEATIRAAMSTHRRMTESVLRSPQLFFDQNPVGRIMNRFSKDQSLMDELLPVTAQGMFENLVCVVGAMTLVGIIIPYFLIALPVFLFALWYWKGRYMPVSRELKRLDGLSRSPIYSHFSQVLSGVTSVRAYGVEKEMHDHFRDLVDANNRALITLVHSARWLGLRLDFGAAMCITLSALLSVLLRHKVPPGYVGVVLIQCLQLAGSLQWGVRLLADTETFFTSVERNQAYSRLPSEAGPKSPPGLITDEWPSKGEVEFVDYTMTYRIDLQPVLNNLTFTVRPREKVGILGRTGAGKSSLAAALFRMVENSACSGSIFIDGIDVKQVGLDDLRLRLSIIPQDPVLFRGTVRLNLDPFNQHNDPDIHEALTKVELTKKIKSLDAGLDSTVTENGENFSVGQRQLLCLARSLLRKSKIIVMDEATAAVDGETDQLIQKTIKTVFHDCTVLTIAHRIETVIDCDRVLVLAKGGRIAEFDSPLNLLRHAEQVNLSDNTTTTTEHVFANMVSQAGPEIAKQLREAAEAADTRRQARE